MNASQNTISIKPLAPVDAASFARLRAAGYTWAMESGAFIATDNDQARELAAEYGGQIETAPPVALPTSGEQIDDDTDEPDELPTSGEQNDDSAELCDDIERATYSPEDNKIRLYPTRRLDAEIYTRVKAAGFSWAPKQGVFVAPMWTPARADLAESLAGELGDEDTTLAERATERAERFEDYHGKRAADAESARRGVDAIAQNIPFGQPILIGHHSERRARRDAERITDGMRRAVKMWETAEYWIQRAAGAIQHAQYKELPAVRARRIKTIEAAQRKSQRDQDQARASLALWDRDGLTLEQARAISGRVWFNVSSEDGHRWTAYDVLRPDGERFKACPAWTVEQVQDHARRVYPRYIAQAQRWIDHYQNRLAYERAMLNESGGLQSDRVMPEKGGAIRCLWAPRGGWAWIVKVNKITVSILYNYGNGGRNFQRNIPLDKINELMSAAETEAARIAGRLFETEDKIGFFLAEPAAPDATPPEPTEPSTAQTSGEQTDTGGDVVTSGEDAPSTGMDPTRPENYAQIAKNPALLEWFEDTLDDFFGRRGHAIRAALSGLSWSGEPHKWPLFKDYDYRPFRIRPSVDTVGAGRNVVGMAWRVEDDAGRVLLRIVDNLSSTPEQIAAELDNARKTTPPESADASEADKVQPSSEQQAATVEAAISFDFERFYTELRETLTAAGWTYNKAREHIEDGDYFIYDFAGVGVLDITGEFRVYVRKWCEGTGGGYIAAATVNTLGKTIAQIAAEIIASTTSTPSGEALPVASIAPLIPGRWIPGGADKAERIAFDAALGIEVWLMDMAGKLSIIAYRGKRTKQEAYYLIRDREKALQWAAQYMADAQADGQRQAERRADKKAKRAAGHKLKAGDVLRSSWGYDQTNIDYYEVTQLIGKSMVEIRKIGRESIESGNMTGDCVPRPGHYIGEPMRKTVSDGGQSVRICSASHARKIETQEVGGVKVYPVDHWTAYA